MIRSITYRLFALFMLIMAGCTGMKNISTENPLYVGHQIKFNAKLSEKKKMAPIIKDILKPEPNGTFLWMRPALARYNMLSEKSRKKKFWKNKVTAPVLSSQVNPLQASAAIQNRMFHQGYFHNTVKMDTVYQGSRKLKYQYVITLREPYRFESVAFPKPVNDITKKINESQQE